MAKTAEIIHGSSPYITFDEGVTKINDTSTLLGITLSDGKIIKADDDVSSESNPIESPNVADTFAKIQTAVPLPDTGNNNYPTINMNDLVRAPYNYFGDEDGDSDAISTGSITVKWESKKLNWWGGYYYADITSTVKSNPDTLLNPCEAPYILTITSTDSQLKTQYGIPSVSEFTGDSHKYYITPNKAAGSVCYAQPNLANAWNGGMTWSAAKGYMVSNAANSGNYFGESSIYNNNFPSTGSHGLHFYLLMKGITPSEVVAINGNKVTAEEGGNVSLTLTAGNTNLWEAGNDYGSSDSLGEIEPGLKITLNGPRYNTVGDKSFKPVTFKLYADSSKSRLLYEFRIMRWYIVQPKVKVNTQAEARSYCASLSSGYRLPDMNDYVNTLDEWIGWGEGLWDNDSENSRRQLSYQESPSKWQGGINNEWGCLANSWETEDIRSYQSGTSSNQCSGYANSDWDVYIGYWSNSIAENAMGGSRYNGRGLILRSYLGDIDLSSDHDDSTFNTTGVALRAACVTP